MTRKGNFPALNILASDWLNLKHFTKHKCVKFKYTDQTKKLAKSYISMKKKRVTAGEVDKLGKELGNCTHQWTTNDDTNTQALLQIKEER